MAHLLTVSGSSENALTATATGIVVPATATYCTLSVGMRGADGTATTLSSATLGGQAFTLDNTNLRVFQTFQSSEGGYILAADMPSGTLTATATRGTATNGMTISVSFFDDVVQNAPIFNTGANAAGGDPFNTSVTMTASGVLVDTISTANGSASFTTNQTGQTQRSTDGPIGNIFSFSSTRAVSSGSQTMGWDTSSNTDRTTHLVMGLEESGGGTSIAQTDTTPEDGAEQTVTCTGMTGPITAATLGGKDILSLLSGTDPASPITYTLDISATESSVGQPRIGETSTLSFTTSTDGAVTTDVTIQPKTGWFVTTGSSIDTATANGFGETVEDELGITLANGNLCYMSQADNEALTSAWVYTSDLTTAGESSAFVIQQGGSATTTATSEGGLFYPYGESEVTAPVMPADATPNRQQSQTNMGTWPATSGESITYSHSGTDSADFTYNASTAQLTFIGDTGDAISTTYDITLTATNGGGADSQDLTITVVADSTASGSNSISISTGIFI